MRILLQLDQCSAATDDLNKNLDIALKLFWHSEYFWIVLNHWQIFKIKFFFPFKSVIVKRISGSECWEDSGTIVLPCWHSDNGPGDPCHTVTCCPLMCHALSRMSRILSQVRVVSAVLPRHAPTSWKMEDGQQLERKRRGHNVTTSFQESSTQSGQDAGVSLSSSNGHQRISLDWHKPLAHISKSCGSQSRRWWMRRSGLSELIIHCLQADG